MQELRLEEELKLLEPRAIPVPARVVERIIAFKLGNVFFRNPLTGAPRHADFIWLDLAELEGISKQIDFLKDYVNWHSEKILILARIEYEPNSQKEVQAARLEYWQRLFKARVQRVLLDLKEQEKFSNSQLNERLETIGQIGFEEALLVLTNEKLLSGDEDEFSQYLEFSSEFLRLYHFSENLLGNYFPSIDKVDTALAIIRKDIPDSEIFAQTRLEGAPEPQPTPETHSEESNEYFQKLSQHAKKESASGNQVGAAILWTQANRIAPAEFSAETMEMAHREIRVLVGRLKLALEFEPMQIPIWEAALFPLLSKADQGSITAEARLLKELQLSCEDFEQEVFRLDMIGWAFSFGKKPLSRPLPLQRQLNIHHRLREAGLRSTTTRLAFNDRKKLEQLILEIGRDHENRLRNAIRPILIESLNKAGLLGEGAHGENARRRLMEEILDRVLDRGFLEFSDLRDMVSRNHLKLEDIDSPTSFFKGDSLLHLDKDLSVHLNGVYRRSDCYLRWLEKLTALNFGTTTGRRINRYLTLPFGGAFLVVEAVDIACDKTIQVRPPDSLRMEAFTFLGLFLLGLINSSWVRNAALSVSKAFFSVFRFFLFDIPKAIIGWEPWKKLFQSRVAQWVYCYLAKPLIFAEAIAFTLPTVIPRYYSDATLFLIFTFFLNTATGRMLTDLFLLGFNLAIKLIKEGLIVILFKIAVEVFRKTLQGLEYLLRQVDNWLRIRGKAAVWKIALRSVLLLVWAPVAFLIRFYLVVLVEPGINPIKFPVSSVAAKFVYPVALPFTATLINAFSPFMGDVAANLVVVSTLWLLPDMFGFLFWETKENWGLYRANRPLSLQPVIVGSQGETVGQMLRPGFYSGTIPRIFHRLRTAEKNAILENDWRNARTLRLELRKIKDRLARFIERDFLVPMQQNNHVFPIPLSVKEIHLGLNRIQADLAGQNIHGAISFSLSFEFTHDWIMGEMDLKGLKELNLEQERCLALGLAGLFKFAGVELTRELLNNAIPGWAFKWELEKDGIQLVSSQGIKNKFKIDREKGLLFQQGNEHNNQTQPSLNWSRSLFYLHPVFWKEWSQGWDRAALNLIIDPLNFGGVEPDILGKGGRGTPGPTIDWDSQSFTQDDNLLESQGKITA